MAKHMAKLTSRRSYFDFKDFVQKTLQGTPLVGKGLYQLAVRTRDLLKRSVVRSTIFTNMGLKYIGPVDGHDIGQLLTVFERAKKLDTSVVVHCFTVKGKGFTDAGAVTSAGREDSVVPSARKKRGPVTGKAVAAGFFGEADKSVFTLIKRISDDKVIFVPSGFKQK